LKKAYGSTAVPPLVTAGGRVLMVVAKGKDLKAARDKALEAVRQIDCPNLFYRTDIGHWAL
jgi:phosphoribosylamine--glycine ligase